MLTLFPGICHTEWVPAQSAAEYQANCGSYFESRLLLTLVLRFYLKGMRNMNSAGFSHLGISR